MDFATARVGWAVGSGQLLGTRDGGRTWVDQRNAYMANTFFDPRRVCAVNQAHCWVITGGMDKIRCFHTKDGGRTWLNVDFGPSIYPQDVFFINQRRGWMVSDDGKVLGGGGTIHLTDNGGETWHSEQLTGPGKPDVIRFVNSRQGWLVESVITKDQAKTIGRVHRSDDSGKNWELAATFERQILDIAVLDGERIFIAGEGGLIEKTVDGGKSWQRLKTRTRANINSIAFYGNSTGIAGADFGTLLMADGNGTVWNKLKHSPDGSNCVGACVASPSQAIIAFDNSIHSLTLSSKNSAAT